MSSNSKPENFRNSDAFIELVSSQLPYDAGLVQFDERMLQLQEELQQKVSETKTGFDSELIDQYEDTLNESWQHEGQIATVTGRVYLADPDVVEIIPEEWELIEEKPADEEEEGYSFFVENVKLRSHGVEVLPVFDETSDTVDDVRIAHKFALADGQFDRPVLRVFPGELSAHSYDIPTMLEAEGKLHREWPREAKIIDTIIRADLTEALPNRLAMVETRLQESLQKSDHFRLMAELYINNRLALKQDLPYLMTINNQLTIFEGGDIKDETSKYDWTRFSLTEPVSLMAYGPHLQFIEGDDGFEASITAYTYSEDGDDEPEYFRARSNSIESFRPMFSKRTLGARALMGEFLVSAASDELRRHRWMLNIPNQEHAVIQGVRHESAKRSINDDRPVSINEMERALERLQDIYKHVKIAQKTIYKTPQDAEKASKQFIDESIAPKLAGLVNSGTLMEFSGSGVTKPNTRIGSLPLDDEREGSALSIYINHENSKASLDAGDWVTGLPEVLVPFSRVQLDSKGEVEGYSIFPSFIVALPVDGKSLMNWQGIDVVNIEVQQRIIVPLDGSATIANKEVNQFHQTREALTAVQEQYGRNPVVKKINRLQSALLSEDREQFVKLMDTSILRTAGKSIDKLAQDGINPAAAMRALETMFSNRRVQLSGEMYRKNNDGTLDVIDTTDDEPIACRILDVRNDVVGTRPVLVIEYAGNSVFHTPLDRISQLHF